MSDNSRDIDHFNSSYHAPVMWREVVGIFQGLSSILIDGTLGGGGHSLALLSSVDNVHVLGLDRDSDAISFASTRLKSFGNRFLAIQSKFSKIADVLATSEVQTWADGFQMSGAIFDLGVSSHQLDDHDRGFSFNSDTSFDMRMDSNDLNTAESFLRTATESHLAVIFAQNGERKFARFLARKIKEATAKSTFGSALELRNLIVSSLPKGYTQGKLDPATKVFQAIRIAVNNELEELETALDSIPSIFGLGSRICIISYHSGEDERVKHVFNRWTKGDCRCPVALECVCGATIIAKSVIRLARPKADEVELNPRARSAKLRAVQFIEPVTVAQVRGRAR